MIFATPDVRVAPGALTDRPILVGRRAVRECVRLGLVVRRRGERTGLRRARVVVQRTVEARAVADLLTQELRERAHKCMHDV